MAFPFEIGRNPAVIVLLSALSLAGCCGSSGSAGCVKDSDCKGNRICSAGACVSPAQPQQNAPPPAAAPAPAPVAQCYNGAVRACDCPGLGKGNQTCRGGMFGPCQCRSRVKAPTGRCVNGQTRACPCGDGTNGQATCLNGRWSSCAMCD